MPPSRLKALLEEAEQLAAMQGDQQRYRPQWARLRRYERVDQDGESVVVPAEWRPRTYGGLWDSVLKIYVPGVEPAPEDVAEISCHAGQLKVFEYESPEGKAAWVKRLMVLGAPGSGKTQTLSIGALLDGLDNPHFTIGMVAATADRVEVMWADFEDVAGSRGFIATRNKHARGGPVMTLWNGARYEFVAAKEPSRRMGSPIQGRSWHRAYVDETQNVLDKAHQDIDERGRRNGKRYRVIESATNIMGGAAGGHFMLRRETYKSNPERDVLRVSPLENVFVEPAHWDTLKASLSEHEWRQRILCEDLPPEMLVYSGFDFGHSVRPAPREQAQDHTRQITAEKLGTAPYLWIAATDFGALCTATIWLKAYKVPGLGLCWWAMHETTSGSHSHAGDHARRLIGFANPDDFIMIADPHTNTKDVDKSDYELTRRAGVTVRPAAVLGAGMPHIKVKHRVSMLNVLFCDANGKRRLFVDCDERGKPKCPRLVQSLMQMTYDEHGNPESVKKDYSDPTHWPAALAYGLFPFERLRGQMTPGAPEKVDPLVERARAIAARRAR